MSEDRINERINDRDYFAKFMDERDRRLSQQLQSLSERINEGEQNLRDHIRMQVGQIDAALKSAQRENTLTSVAQKEAVGKAFESSTALAQAHNDLLRKMEKQGESFATKDAIDTRFSRLEHFQASLTGGMLLLGFIGVANLVKVWT